MSPGLRVTTRGEGKGTRDCGDGTDGCHKRLETSVRGAHRQPRGWGDTGQEKKRPHPARPTIGDTGEGSFHKPSRVVKPRGGDRQDLPHYVLKTIQCVEVSTISPIVKGVFTGHGPDIPGFAGASKSGVVGMSARTGPVFSKKGFGTHERVDKGGPADEKGASGVVH